MAIISAGSLTAVGGVTSSSLEGQTSLQHLSLTYQCLAKLSLERSLDDATLTTFLSKIGIRIHFNILDTIECVCAHPCLCAYMPKVLLYSIYIPQRRTENPFHSISS